VPTTSVDISLAFGDSITAGVTADLAEYGTLKLQVRINTTPYSERLRALLQERYPAQNIGVENAGLPGEWAQDGQKRLPGVLKPAHDLMILLEGVNGLGSTLGAVTAERDALRNMVNFARGQGKQVFLLTLTPVYPNGSGLYPADPAMLDALNARIRLLADTGATIVDMFAAFGNDRSLMSADGLHPSASGYQKMAQVLYDAIVAKFETLQPPADR
jgi:lysophospholipase L1-like esterase